MDDPARLLSLPLLDPTLTTRQVTSALEQARRYGFVSVLARPCDIDLAVQILHGSSVRPASVCGFPNGIENTATKLYEARDLLRRGAREIHTVASIPKLLSREFQHVQTELSQLGELCYKEGAVYCVIVENSYLSDELKLIACRAAERSGAGLVKSRWVPADIQLLRKDLPEAIGLIAAGEIASLNQLAEVQAAGITAVETASAAALAEQWKSAQSTRDTATGTTGTPTAS
jgi:deoxyribose-phosphate aldolase